MSALDKKFRLGEKFECVACGERFSLDLPDKEGKYVRFCSHCGHPHPFNVESRLEFDWKNWYLNIDRYMRRFRTFPWPLF